MTVIEPTDPPPVPGADAVSEQRRAEEGRRRAIFGLVGGFLLVLVVIFVVQWITDSEDTVEGDPLPEAALVTLDGEDFPLTSVVGEPTVLNFFASWCGPCRAELPEFQEVSQAVADDGVRFVGINTRETDVDSARELIDQTGVTYTVALGDDGSLFEQIGGLGMPTTAFVDATGNIVEVHSGILRGDDLASKIQEHFG